MADELPFKAEYAKSGRAKCKGCKEPIAQGALRLAAMVQSAFFDGKQANWYDMDCFFKKQRPKSVADIDKVNSLRYEDQKKIEGFVAKCSTGAIMPVEKGKKGKAKKRSSAVAFALNDYGIEYSISSRARCKECEIIITKGEIRVSKKDFDTEIGQKYGGQVIWRHLKCFADARSELMFFCGGEELPGFKSLSKEDKAVVKKQLLPLKVDEVPVKKLKEEPADDETKKKAEKIEKEIKSQAKLVYKYRDGLKMNLTKKDLQYLLEYNDQEIPVGEDRILDRLADAMAFGVLQRCKVCKNGQLVLGTEGYKCTGDVSEWTKCQAVTLTPDRKPFKVPDSLKTQSPLATYKYKPKSRVFNVPVTSSVIVSSSQETKVKIEERAAPPLKNLEFFIYGLSSKDKEALKVKILRLGGLVPSSLKETCAAVVTTQAKLDGDSDKIREVEKLNIQVLEPGFFDEIKPAGTVMESINLITDKNIATWGSHPTTRIPKDVVDGKSIAKSGKSMYSKSSSGPKKLTLKDGSAVDPDSGLQDVAHVYRDWDNTRYNVVLGKADVVSNKNSFYKLQILKADNKDKFWLFRSWGRIGTSIGGNKTEPCQSLSEAMSKFESLYCEKTENDWNMRDYFMKVPGKMYPIEVDYGDDAPAKVMALDDVDSTLPKPVQSLVKMIFDIEVMKKVLLEFELDTEKMPLGKLSRKQLMAGYKVLTGLLKTITQDGKEDSKEDSRKVHIIDGTNRFYTLVPHDFGMDSPPLLNNEEIIRTKTLMLDNLLEIEIAYNMLKDTKQSAGSPLDTHYIQLKSEIVPIVTGSPEYEMALTYVTNTHAQTHSTYSLELLQLFKVNRNGEEKRYKPFKKLHNRKLLWHGSRVTNFAGILSKGLRIAPPEAPVSGYMFGKGIYFADMVSKSANYCCTNVNSPQGVLLLCEVALGNMKELGNAEYVTKLPSGMHSVKGIGRTEPDPKQDLKLECGTVVPLGKPITKKTKTSLLYNEYIVYDVAQVHVKYLFQMKFNYKF